MEYSQGYEERERGADRRDEFAAPYQPQPHPAPQPSSPSASASPFAFAPPPLASRPPQPMQMHQHHSDPTNAYPYYQQRPPMAQTQSYSYPAASSAPMGAYRSYSNDSGMPAQRASPQAMTRTPSLSIIPATSSLHSQAPSPTSAQSPYPYARQVSTSSQPYGGASPQRGHVYPNGYYAPPPHLQSVDMPRSSSYPSYAQPYPSPSYHHPGMHHPPSLMRHNTTEGMSHGTDMGMRPSMGYSFANRLPLVDRPFKCDECVQSFNRNHDLKRHKRIHLSVKPFGCDKCGKTFSRKDALRRHWLVKGCRGEDGATDLIVPLFPINDSRPPALSPPSPSQNSPIEASDPSRSYGQAPPPAPLHTLPTRHSTDNQIIVTPDEHAAQGGVRSEPMIASLDEPMTLDNPALNPHGSHRSSAGSMHGESYFDVGMKQDNGMVEQTSGATNSPYTRYPHSPASAPAYRREGAVDSPRRVLASPTAPYMQQSRSYSPSGMLTPQGAGPDGRPVFAMPFAPNGYVAQDGLLGPPIDGAPKMERNASHDSVDPGTWQRWHRPSFPFPPPSGVNYNTYEQTSSPADGAPASRQSFAQ